MYYPSLTCTVHYCLPICTVNVDMTRVITSVLLQETQTLDSKGEATIASTYTSWLVLQSHTCHVHVRTVHVRTCTVRTCT